ncbi:MAG: DUF1761 domain-containing protein [Gammaproteobacteria bacterium]
MGIRIIGIVVAAVIMFAIGGIWYSPMLFARAWSRETGITEHKPTAKSMLRFSIALLVLLLACASILACILASWLPGHDWLHGLAVGFLCGVLASAVVGMNTLFERKSTKLFVINSGYYLVGFCLMGIIVAVI